MTPQERLSALARRAEAELRDNILPFWFQTMDHRGGGFAGLVTPDNKIDLRAPKGIVMHARHLWASSSAWLERRNPLDRQAADHAYAFLAGKLLDREGRGFWWIVDAKGHPQHETKVLYGQGFAVYGLAQYFRATGNREALTLALETFRLLEKTGRDREFGGYYEAVDRHWTTPVDLALSDVDLCCAKSMNTNLHILEAYTALFVATGLAEVREALSSLLEVFQRRMMVTPEHLGLYFDRQWTNLSARVSFGHDIEASWLMTEAAEVLHGRVPAAQKAAFVTIAHKTLTLVQAHGGSLPNELHDGHLDTDRVWWVQAEALVGLVNGWELTGDEAFLTAAERLWDYIVTTLVNREHGEWHWLVRADGTTDPTRPKGGLWKTSYHNGRACLEIMIRSRR